MNQTSREAADTGAELALEKTYSAQELGDMMNDEPLKVYELDLGFQTQWFNCDYIEKMLSYVRKENDMKMLMRLIEFDWRKKTVELHPKVAYRAPVSRAKIPYVKDLPDLMTEMADRIKADREQISQCESFRQQFLKLYSEEQPEASPTESSLSTEPPPPVRRRERPSADDEPDDMTIKLDELPESLRKHILVSQQVFDVLVRQLNEDVWLIVDGNRGKYCDLVRFLLIKHEVFAKTMTRDLYNDFLHRTIAVLKDTSSLMSSLGRRTETSGKSMDKSLRYYDSPVKSQQDEVWQLRKDCVPLEESLQPVFDAMSVGKSTPF